MDDEDSKPHWLLRILEKQGFAVLFGCCALYIGMDLAQAHKKYLLDTTDGLKNISLFAERTDEKHNNFDLQLAELRADLVELRADQQRTSQAIIGVLRELSKNPQAPLTSTASGA